MIPYLELLMSLGNYDYRVWSSLVWSGKVFHIHIFKVWCGPVGFGVVRWVEVG